MDTILGLLDEEAKSKAFKAGVAAIQTSNHLPLDQIRICIKLRPYLKSQLDSRSPDHGHTAQASTQNTQDPMEQPNETLILTESLYGLLLLRISEAGLASDQLYELAELLSSDGLFMSILFGKMQNELNALLPGLRKSNSPEDDEIERQKASRNCTRKATAYLMLLKCSYWLPNDCNHVIDPNTLKFLIQFLAVPSIQEVAYGALSAFLLLLKRGAPVAVASHSDDLPPWLQHSTDTDRVVLTKPIVDSSMWDHLCSLNTEYFTSDAQTVTTFRVWFLWISQVALDEAKLECLHLASYWDKIRLGLLHGHTEQRKYCLAIFHQSLLVAQQDIDLPFIQLRVIERAKYMKTYELYVALFETIVLDRYANQVQACLPELTKLFNSNIPPLLASTLLSASLNPTVQVGVRKIIGNWYIDFVIKTHGNISGHTPFFLASFLPWATSGELFTATLVSTRDHTYTRHGASLVDVVARFISQASDEPLPIVLSPITSTQDMSTSSRVAVFGGVLDFILDTQGRVFHFAILYLLEGLINGLRELASRVSLKTFITPLEIDEIIRISRFPGLPEITSDLCKEYCDQLRSLTDPVGANAGMLLFEQTRNPVLAMRERAKTLPSSDLPPLRLLRAQLEETRHHCIQGENYATVCDHVANTLDRTDHIAVDQSDLYTILDALWEEADRRQFVRPVALHIPGVIFHPVCIRICVLQRSKPSHNATYLSFTTLLTGAMERLQKLAEGRSYILSTLGMALRKAVFSSPDIIEILPFEDHFIRFLNNAPTIRPEFLFEVAAAQKLQKHQPHRTYSAYYGQREWHAYATTIDLLRRFPQEHLHVAKRVLDRLLEPWRIQRAGGPIISKWKNVLQLQAMLLLVDFCIVEADVDEYLANFWHALVLEPWPRYRFLLEWILARIYYRFPGRASTILTDLANIEKSSSSQIASLMKLAVLVAPNETEEFSTTFMTKLGPFSASPKVQIRHESNYALPIIFDLARCRGWRSITENPAFTSLDEFVRSLDKFQVAPWTIRTLKLDIVKDYTLRNIFQGQYLTIESPDRESVAFEDFLALQEADDAAGLRAPPERVPLGRPVNRSLSNAPLSATPILQTSSAPEEQIMPAYFQTKAGSSIDSLYPLSGPPGSDGQRPASIVLVASLVDNPTNLGGLSRISESFGIEALHIDDLRKISHKDFRATSVTSEKHLRISELKVPEIPAFLMQMKRDEYEVVGIEQTGQSGILGTPGGKNTDLRVIGTLPQKCVLVLGSEKGGITVDVLAVVDRCVEIKTVGVTRSLNVQTAAGIAIFEWWREWPGKTRA
ncbi:hypothetical protein FB567DRAFT_570739 [Paraphoma chrysanthemicola]|uniref:tRNA/rRNA methyltransferase SpoU type domain-containing protein n=1 Tax=Paraphoma chrysanthemicola TaxID=798071 RepID=A0A8K0VWJ9_9PLEO|nr:hypothetical protein FB567DRAFT_570739 [Paraphoma chrysanthemicola]